MTGRECDRIHEIWLEQALGRALPAQKLAVLDGHLAQCGACRAEQELTDLLRFDGTSGPAPELDDLARRRWIDQVMERMPRSGSVVTAPATEADRPVVIPWSLKLSAGLAAAAAIAVVIGLQFADFSSNTTLPAPSRAIVAQAPSVAQGSYVRAPSSPALLLSGGEVTIGGAAVAGDEVAYSAPIVTNDGHAVIDAPNDVRLFVSSQSRMVLPSPTAESQSIILDRGKLISEVSPDRIGPPVVVSTRLGEIVVTGTVFSVEVTDADVAVQVYRGSVVLHPLGGEAAPLSFGQGAGLDANSRWSIVEDERVEVESVLRTFGILTREGSSRLEIGSAPAGADVLINGISVGKTPFFAAVREGSRSLEVAMSGYTPVREMLHPKPSETTLREFELLEAKAIPPRRAALKRRPVKALRDNSAVGEPGELLAIAQSFRAAKNWWQAHARYQELINRFPKSPEARAAMVSSGTILLENLGKPEEALRAFEGYLTAASRGVLAQEAAYGRAQALRRMGANERELTALRDFLARFPSALQAERVKARLRELQPR